MDEGTLNDLLECSVCLERLDTSSKVLPCQHTFCKKCLEEIVVTKKELRCPECRVLVETSIDDLPPNVLLMRILEGMRNAAPNRRGTGAPSIHHQRSYSQPVGGTIFPSATMASAVPAAITQHAPHSLTPDGMIRIHSNMKHHMPQAWPPPYARAVYDYVSKEPGDLSFKKGDIITLKKQVDQNWYHGEIGGVHGVFPLCYVQIMPPPSNIPQCKAMFDFRMANEEEEGCLTFKKGEIMTVIRRVDENWVEGRKGDRVGIFPIAFVQMNDVARAFIKLTTNIQPGPSRIAPPTPTSEETTPLIPTDHSQVPVNLQQHPSAQSAAQMQHQPPHQAQIPQSQNQIQNPSLAQPLQQVPHSQAQSFFQLQPQSLLQPQLQLGPQPQLQAPLQPQPQLQAPLQPQLQAPLQPQLQPPLQPQTQPTLQPQPQPQNQTQPQTQPQPQPQTQPQPAPASSAPKPPTSVAASFTADSSSSSSSSTTPNTSSTSSSSSSSTTPSSPASPPPRPSAWSPQTRPSRSSTGSSHDSSHNQQKRHSLTALLAAPAQQSSSNRHSAEVLGSADLSEASIEVPPNGEFVRQGSGRHHRRSGSSELPLSSVGSVPPPLPQGIHHSLVNNSNLPATYIALYPYKPQKADELELRKGGVYTVTERCQDGWFKGTSNRTQKSGVFPGNYVAFVKSVPGAQQQSRSATRSGANSNTPTRSASSGAVSPHSSAAAAASTSTTSPSPVSYTKERKSNSSSPQTSSQRQQPTGSEPPTLPPRSVSPAQSLATAGAVSWHSHQSNLTATEATRTTPSTSPQAPPAQATQSSPQSPQSSVSPNSASTSAAPSTITPVGTPMKTSSDKVKEKKERGSVSLMRRLTNMKKSKSPPPPYSMDNPVFEDGSVFGTPTHSVHPAHPVHVRSGSCPSQLLQLPLPESQQSQPQHHRAVPATTTATGAGGSQRLRHKERQNVVVTNFAPSGRQGDGVAASASAQTPSSHHRKSNSLDAGSSASSNGHSTSSPHGSSHGESSRKSKPLVQPARERFRCVVAYPPHSEYELELRVGDVIYVHRKREDGWYKGTQQRTGRTGLFPASFVEAF